MYASVCLWQQHHLLADLLLVDRVGYSAGDKLELVRVYLWDV